MCVALLHFNAQILTPWIFGAQVGNVETWTWSKSLYKVLGLPEPQGSRQSLATKEDAVFIFHTVLVCRWVFTANVRGLHPHTRGWIPGFYFLVFPRGCAATEMLPPGYKILFSPGCIVTGSFWMTLCFACSPVDLIHLILLLCKNTITGRQPSVLCNVTHHVSHLWDCCYYSRKSGSIHLKGMARPNA